jgi:DNA-binding MarR family transcriptional regulator
LTTDKYQNQENRVGAWKSHFLVLTASLDVVRERLEKHYATRGLSLREIWILMSARDKPSSQKCVADMLGINSNVMVGLVDRMQKKDFIVRTKNPENRRENILTVTKNGRALVKWADENYDVAAKKVWHPIPLEALDGILQHALSILREEAKHKSAGTVQ